MRGKDMDKLQDIVNELKAYENEKSGLNSR